MVYFDRGMNKIQILKSGKGLKKTPQNSDYSLKDMLQVMIPSGIMEMYLDDTLSR